MNSAEYALAEDHDPAGTLEQFHATLDEDELKLMVQVAALGKMLDDVAAEMGLSPDSAMKILRGALDKADAFFPKPH